MQFVSCFLLVLFPDFSIVMCVQAEDCRAHNTGDSAAGEDDMTKERCLDNILNKHTELTRLFFRRGGDALRCNIKPTETL